MKTLSNILIGIGMTALIIGSMMVDDVSMPMTDKQFMIQIACLIGGIGTAIIGGITRIMAE
jgi:hypothetical protein